MSLFIFFQVTDYDTIIFEDLDRFENLDIFLKLKEINHLINQNEIIQSKKNSPIKFIYAIKDDLFQDGLDRVKFFDFIINTIPVISSYNSRDMLIKLIAYNPDLLNLKEILLEGSYDKILKHVNDMRILKNILNEHKQYVGRFKKYHSFQLDSNKIFGLILYKNLYPQDFSELYKDKGVLYSIAEYILQNESAKENRLKNYFWGEIEKLAETYPHLKNHKNEFPNQSILIQTLMQKNLIDSNYKDLVNNFYEGYFSESDREYIKDFKTYIQPILRKVHKRDEIYKSYYKIYTHPLDKVKNVIYKIMIIYKNEKRLRSPLKSDYPDHFTYNIEYNDEELSFFDYFVNKSIFQYLIENPNNPDGLFEILLYNSFMNKKFKNSLHLFIKFLTENKNSQDKFISILNYNDMNFTPQHLSNIINKIFLNDEIIKPSSYYGENSEINLINYTDFRANLYNKFEFSRLKEVDKRLFDKESIYTYLKNDPKTKSFYTYKKSNDEFIRKSEKISLNYY